MSWGVSLAAEITEGHEMFKNCRELGVRDRECYFEQNKRGDC
jgi:hypothetical protein